MTFAAGSLVRARGREWVVLPESREDLLVLRPLGGSDDEVTGLYLPLERVEPATFPPPTAADLGDFRSGRLLRDALRLGFRESATPIRCLAHIAVEPRPYQLVPLLMALKLDPVRLLIADDVGVGKTVEACLIARELLDQGEVQRFAVLCPPHLAEQWQRELGDKFHIEAEAVLPGTAARLERGLRLGESLFDRYPFVVVSTDFIKSDRRREEFVRACPELVIVDEAHTCADQSGGRSSHQRYALVSRLASVPDRHLILVTATPHSGREEGFRNLLGFLESDLRDLPDDLAPEERRAERRRLARHFVQRRRGDIAHYLAADTPFPRREAVEVTYGLSAEYKELFRRALRFCRETVRDAEGGRHRQRVRWWAALGLLRAISSSPAAASATLRQRAKVADTGSPEEADEVGRRAILDLVDDEAAEGTDVSPGADPGDEGESASSTRRRLLELARQADALRGGADQKLARARDLVREMVRDGFRPIVFCRFIETAEYVAGALRAALPADVEVAAVTGRLPHAEREARVEDLAGRAKRVLVATDCLSEGINLQDHFDAVLHYDLSWNPTRHEQREGRVDRFGQPRSVVKAVMYYGADNPVDGIVLDVLLRKHRAIRTSLGISVPVPAESQALLEAILEGLLLRGAPGDAIDEQLTLFTEDVVAPRRTRLHADWDRSAERERRSRTIFAQEGIKAEDVARELEAVRRAIGSGRDVARFLAEGLVAAGAAVDATEDRIRADLARTPRALRDLLQIEGDALAARLGTGANGEIPLARTHPIVEGFASYVLESALDPLVGTPVARRAGVIRTRVVSRRTTLLLLRMRFDVVRTRGGDERRRLAEDVGLVAFAGPPTEAAWLPDDEAERLLEAAPDRNIAPDQARGALERILEGLDRLVPQLEAVAHRRAGALEVAYARLREGARLEGPRVRVEPRLPVDLLGLYVYLPAE